MSIFMKNIIFSLFFLDCLCLVFYCYTNESKMTSVYWPPRLFISSLQAETS